MHEYSKDVTRNTSSVLCTDKGNNECALAMEELFVTTHANFTQILARADKIETALGEDMKDSLFHTIEEVDEDIEMLPSHLRPPPPPHSPSYVEPMDFARLSVCMHRAKVDHTSLDLPMGLRQISGNGSYTSFSDLFFDKCGVGYEWAWVWEDLYHYSGLHYAAMRYSEDGAAGKVFALVILVADVLILLCLVACLGRCIQKGHCFWLCLKMSGEEKASLTAEPASRATEMGELSRPPDEQSAASLERLDDDFTVVDSPEGRAV